MGLVEIDEGETYPAGLGRGNNPLGGWLGQVRQAKNALLVKRWLSFEIDEGET